MPTITAYKLGTGSLPGVKQLNGYELYFHLPLCPCIGMSWYDFYLYL